MTIIDSVPAPRSGSAKRRLEKIIGF